LKEKSDSKWGSICIELTADLRVNSWILLLHEKLLWIPRQEVPFNTRREAVNCIFEKGRERADPKRRDDDGDERWWWCLLKREKRSCSCILILFVSLPFKDLCILFRRWIFCRCKHKMRRQRNKLLNLMGSQRLRNDRFCISKTVDDDSPNWKQPKIRERERERLVRKILTQELSSEWLQKWL
jgi:hypothetical protein